jgi:2,3-bisphosphoglycerate-independent phosphoglycerate mutase
LTFGSFCYITFGTFEEKAGRMKYVVIVGDGMADLPLEALGGRTPLEAARTPNMDWMAGRAEIGLVRTVPEGFTPGSEIANLSILGYDPVLYYKGRGPLEAASLGVNLAPGDIAFRCNLVSLRGTGDQTVMEDFAAGHITDQEAKELIHNLNQTLTTDDCVFYPGVSYRHLLLWREGATRFPGLESVGFTPPHDIIGREIDPFLPRAGGGVKEILSLMAGSRRLLEEHPVNVSRRSRGLLPANSIWLWGQGQAPKMATLKERFGIEGSVISAVHLLKGIGILAGLRSIEVPGATGYFDTNYEGKAECALKSLWDRDFVFVHVEAPDEAGHHGDARLKIEAIEAFDRRVVGPILKGMEVFENFRILLLPDHPTPICLRTHTADPVPYVIYSSRDAQGPARGDAFNEAAGARSGILEERGFELLGRLLTGEGASGECKD